MPKKFRRLFYFLFVLFALLTVIYYHISTQDYKTLLIRDAEGVLNMEVNKRALETIYSFRNTIIKEADKYDFDPSAIAGIIVAEASMHSAIANQIEEYLVRNRLLSKDSAYLEALAQATSDKVAEKKNTRRKYRGI